MRARPRSHSLPGEKPGRPPSSSTRATPCWLKSHFSSANRRRTWLAGGRQVAARGMPHREVGKRLASPHFATVPKEARSSSAASACVNCLSHVACRGASAKARFSSADASIKANPSRRASRRASRAADCAPARFAAQARREPKVREPDDATTGVLVVQDFERSRQPSPSPLRLYRKRPTAFLEQPGSRVLLRFRLSFPISV